MNFKLAEVANIKEPLDRLSQLPLPFAMSRKLAKTIKNINEEWIILEDQRTKLIRKYGEEQPDPRNPSNTIISVKQENMNEFFKEFSNVLEQEADVEVEQFKVEEIPEDIKISPQDLIFLNKVIID